MVFIKLFNQQTLSLNLNPNSTSLQTLIQTIESKTTLPPHLQRLFLSSRRLLIDESNAIHSISSLDMNRHSTLVLHVPLLGGMQAHVAKANVEEVGDVANVIKEVGNVADVIKEVGGADEKAVGADVIQEVGGADEKAVGADVIQEVGGADEKAVGADVIQEVGGADEKAGDEVVATSVEVPVDAAEMQRHRRAKVVEFWEKNEIKYLEEKMQKEFGEIDSWKAAHKVRLENEIVRLQTELGKLDEVAEVLHSSAKGNFETECARIRVVAARNLAPAKWFGCFGV